MPIPLNPFDLAPHTAPRAADLNTIFGVLYDALDKTQVGLGADNFEDESFALSKFPNTATSAVVHLGGMKPAGPFASPAVALYKDQIGIVRIDSSWIFGPGVDMPIGLLLGQFPAGFRPGYTQYITFWHVSSTPAWASLAANGDLVCQGHGTGPNGSQAGGPSPARYSFSGWWYAEN